VRAGTTPPTVVGIAGVLAVALALASCAAQGDAPDVRITPRTQVNNPALATLPDVPVISDIPYADNGGERQLLDACVPPDDVTAHDPGPYPAIVVVHGGSWSHGDKADIGYRAICQWLASAGFPAFDLDYRLAPQHPYPAAIEDVRAAVEWLRRPAQVARFGIDPARIGGFGGSAGGNLVSLLATEGDGGRTTGSRVAAVVEMSGPADLTGAHANPDFIPDQLAYLHCASESDCPAARAASPVFHVDRTDPPFLITHSSAESTIPLAQSQTFVAALRKAGVDTTFVVVRGRAHSIAMMNDDLKNRIIAFYRRTLGAKPVGTLN
jgi:acetyl esterase/lipase